VDQNGLQLLLHSQHNLATMRFSDMLKMDYFGWVLCRHEHDIAVWDRNV